MSSWWRHIKFPKFWKHKLIIFLSREGSRGEFRIFSLGKDLSFRKNGCSIKRILPWGITFKRGAEYFITTEEILVLASAPMPPIRVFFISGRNLLHIWNFISGIVRGGHLSHLIWFIRGMYLDSEIIIMYKEFWV